MKTDIVLRFFQGLLVFLEFPRQGRSARMRPLERFITVEHVNGAIVMEMENRNNR